MAAPPVPNFEELWKTYSTITDTNKPPAFVFIANYINEPERREYIKNNLKTNLSENYFKRGKALPSSDELWKLLPNILFNMEYTNTTFIGPTESYEKKSNVPRTYDDAKEDHQIKTNIDPISEYFWEGGGAIRPEQRDKWYVKIKKFYEEKKVIPDFKTRLDYAKEVLNIPAAGPAAAPAGASSTTASSASPARPAGPPAAARPAAASATAATGASSTAARPAGSAKSVSTAVASAAKTPILHGPVPNDPELKKQTYPVDKYNKVIDGELDVFKNSFTPLYGDTKSASSNEYFVATLVYFYIIQSVEDTILLSMLIFNYGSEYSQDVLYGTNSTKEYDLSFFIEGRENYITIEREKNEHVNAAILESLGTGLTDSMITIIIKLYIVRYYRVAILNKICKNIQEFTQAIKRTMTHIIGNATTIASIESIVSSINSNTASSTVDATQLYKEILGTSNIGRSNNIIKYSYIMYYKALINFAVSISLKEPIPIEAIIHQVNSDASLDKDIKDLLIKHKSRFDNLYNLLLPEMNEPITYSIFTGLHSSKLFKETKISTCEEYPVYLPTMGKYEKIYDLFRKYSTTKDSTALQEALGFTKSTSASGASRPSTAFTRISSVNTGSFETGRPWVPPLSQQPQQPQASQQPLDTFEGRKLPEKPPERASTVDTSPLVSVSDRLSRMSQRVGHSRQGGAKTRRRNK